ncbi:MAG: hypothetical protein WBE05_04800, partial [Pseudolabrys sp.]
MAFQAITQFGNLKPLFRNRLHFENVGVPNLGNFRRGFPRLPLRKCQTFLTAPSSKRQSSLLRMFTPLKAADMRPQSKNHS